MKCPHCENDHKRRYGMTCSRCRYRFVFDPKADGLGDRRFQLALDAVSASGERWFTAGELYARLARAMLPGAAGCTIGGVFLGVIVGVVLGGGWWFALIPPLAWIGYLTARRQRSPLTRQKFNGLFARWRQANPGSVQTFIDKPSLGDAPKSAPDPDVFDYGAQCVIVTQHDYLVDWLVRNDAHLAHQAIVISATGYPDHLKDRVKDLLEARDRVPVYLLHDTSDEGKRMHSRVLNLPWAPFANARLVDFGLHRDQIEQLKPFRRLKMSGTITPDMIGFTALGSLLTVAIAERIALAEVLSRKSSHAEYEDFG